MDSAKLKQWGLKGLKYVFTTIAPIIVAALILGTPLTGLIRLRTLLPFLQTSIPLWMLLIALAVCVAMGTAFPWAKPKPRPKLHVSWELGQCAWGIASSAGESVMQLTGLGLISSEGTNERLVIRQAYIKGTTPVMNLVPELIVQPGELTRCMIGTFVKPVTFANTEPISAPMILVDHKNRKYRTPTVTFRPASGQRHTNTGAQ